MKSPLSAQVTVDGTDDPAAAAFPELDGLHLREDHARLNVLLRSRFRMTGEDAAGVLTHAHRVVGQCNDPHLLRPIFALSGRREPYSRPTRELVAGSLAGSGSAAVWRNTLLSRFR